MTTLVASASASASASNVEDIEQGISDAETSSSTESCSVSEIVGSVVEHNGGRRSSSVSSSSSVSVSVSVSEHSVDLENAVISSNSTAKRKRDCRICQLSFDGSNPTIELGCCCKNDLAAAHQHCAQAWFKIRGNKTCEICGSTAQNVVGVNEVELIDQWNEANETAQIAALPRHPIEIRRFWQGHRFLNFLLACMVFAFVISWLFHFNVPS